MRRLFALLLCLCWLSACLPTVAGVAAYKMSQNRTQNQYRQYISDLEKTNQQRRDQGLEPMPVKTFTQWKEAK